MKNLVLALSFTLCAAAQTAIPLDAGKLEKHGVEAADVTYKGKKAIRLTDVNQTGPDGSRLAIIPGTAFTDGVVELELAGDAKPGAPETVRGFVGFAFRVQPGGKSYEAFYLRPKNGRSPDQVQRNHSAQYISIPEFGWKRLREETPKKYETYVDLVPGEWTKVRIEVAGAKARLYVHGASQPTLIVNDLEHGETKGSLALWLDTGVVAHSTGLRVTPGAPASLR